MSKAYVILMLLIAGIVLWIFRPTPQYVARWSQIEPDKRLKTMPMVDIDPPKVSVYAASAKRKLNLPDDIKDDPNKYVLTSSRLPKDTHSHTVTTVIDAETGSVQTYTRREPLPWISAEKTGELRIDYGIKRGFDRIARLSYREDLIQVKALHTGVNASLDTDGAWFVGAGVGWRW